MGALDINNYYISLVPIVKAPKYLKKFKDCLTDSILDASVIFYYKGNKVVYSKLVFNVLNIPENVLFSADFFDLEVHKETLANFPII
jgi:hypothetical protein